MPARIRLGLLAAALVVLALPAPAGASYSSAVLANSPHGYWALADNPPTLNCQPGICRARAVDAAPTGLFFPFPAPFNDISGLFERSDTDASQLTLGVPGPVGAGTAAEFNGGRLLTTAETPFSDRTIELWVRWDGPASLPSDLAAFFDKSDCCGKTIAIGGQISTGRIVVAAARDNPGDAFSVTLSSPPGMRDGAWHHVVFTRDSASRTLALYVDGVLADSKLSADNPVEAYDVPSSGFGVPVNVWSKFADASRPMQGALAHIALYPTALTSGDVAAHYAAALEEGRAAAPGQSVSTGTDATPASPLQLTVTPSAGGTVGVSANATPTFPAPSGYGLATQELSITAPDGTSTSPIHLVFRLDASKLGTGQAAAAVAVTRNGVTLPDCLGATAVPAPGNACVTRRSDLTGGDVEIEVIAIQASAWGVLLPLPLHYEFAGFFAPLRNPPGVNQVPAGLPVPVMFSLGGAQGLDVLAAGHPRSQQIVCGTNPATAGTEATTTPFGLPLLYVARADRYAYVWQTKRAWDGTCRQLVLKLRDGTVARANFRFR